MFGLGAPELIVILVVALLVFGPGRLPEVGGALGKSIRDFRKSFRGAEDGPTELDDRGTDDSSSPRA